MNVEQGTSESIDPAIPVADSESVVWTGRPRVTVVVPAAIVGLALIVAGLGAVVLRGIQPAVVLILIGVVIPIWRYLQNQRTQYVITDEAIYKKTGVFSRAVSQAMLHTVQNSAFSQSLTGSIFGYGSVGFEIAGGGQFTFQRIGTPREVRSLVDEATGQTDTVTGTQRGAQSVPGSTEQWLAIRDEVQALHHVVNRRTK